MKVRLRRAFLSLLTVFSMLITLFPAAALAEEQSSQDVNRVANGSFEEVANGKPVGWVPLGASNVFESVYEPVYDGAYSVKLTDTSSSAGSGIRSQPVAVTPGSYYLASAYGYNESGSSQLYFEFWNAANVRIDVKFTSVPSRSQWQKTELLAAAPEDAVYATVLLYQHQSNVGVAYFDQVELIEVTGELPFNHDFEAVSAGKPVGWTPLGTVQYETESSIVYSGNHSVKMVDPSDNAGPGLRSGGIPVVPEELYRGSVFSYNEAGTSQLYVEYWNSSNVRIDVKIATNSSIGQWSEIAIESYAPAEASYATLLLYQHRGNIGTAYFDQAAFDRIPPEPVREFPLLVDSHPRLYFTADELPELAARAADTANAPFGKTGKQLWDPIKSAADAYLNETSFSRTYYADKVVTFPLPPVQPGPIENPPGFTSPYPYWTMMSRSIQDRLETLSLAYAVTGNTAYADKAKLYMLSLAEWDSWTDPTYPCGGATCLDTSHFTFGVSMAFDVLYDLLTPAERTTMIHALETKGLAPLFKDVRSKLDHNIQSLRAAALGSGAAVLLGHSPKADAYLTRAMEYYRWYLDERMDSGQQEGFLYTSYAMDNMIKAFDHINRVTGVRELADHPFLNDFLVRWVVYALAPGGAGLSNFSDSGTVNYFGLTMNVINAWLNNGQAGWYLKETGAAAGGTDGFLYFRPDATITSPEEEWPASTVLDENGWALLRSGWDNNDVLFAMISNKSRLGHNHYDQNSFQIATNRTWIAGDPGYQDYVKGPVNDLTVRLGHSTIQVDGHGQTVLGTGTMTKGFLAPSYDYVKGSAPGAYGSQGLTKYDRHVVYLKPDTFVMLDDLQAAAPHVYDWILFSGALSEYEIDGQVPQEGQAFVGNDLYLRAGGAELAAKFLSDNKLPITVTRHPGAESYGYYTRVSNGEAVQDHRFLTVIKTQPYTRKGLYDETNLLPLTDSSDREVRLVSANGVTVIFYRGAQAGDFMTVTIDVPETGTYKLQSQFLKSPLYGMVQTYVDGQPAGGVYDGYAPTVEGPVLFEHGNIHLTAGTHTIKYEVVGKNELSGNYFIGLDEIRLLTNDGEQPGKLRVNAEPVYGVGGVGALVEHEGAGTRDLAIFGIDGAAFDIGGVRGDAEQAVVSFGQDDTIVSFSMTRGTSLQTEGQLLLSGSASFSASFDTDAATAELRGVVETVTAQPIRVHAPTDSWVIVSGQLLEPNSYSIDEASRTIEITLAEGRHDVRIVSVSAQVGELLKAGKLNGPMAEPIVHAARQAQHHWLKGSAEQAIHHLQRGLNHLNNPSLEMFIADSAKIKLDKAIQRILSLI